MSALSATATIDVSIASPNISSRTTSLPVRVTAGALRVLDLHPMRRATGAWLCQCPGFIVLPDGEGERLRPPTVYGALPGRVMQCWNVRNKSVPMRTTPSLGAGCVEFWTLERFFLVTRYQLAATSRASLSQHQALCNRSLWSAARPSAPGTTGENSAKYKDQRAGNLASSEIRTGDRWTLASSSRPVF